MGSSVVAPPGFELEQDEIKPPAGFSLEASEPTPPSGFQMEDPTTMANRELAKQGLSVSAPRTRLPEVAPIPATGPYPEYKSKVSPEKAAQFKAETAAAQDELLSHPVENAGNMAYPGLGEVGRGASELATKGK